MLHHVTSVGFLLLVVAVDTLDTLKAVVFLKWWQTQDYMEPKNIEKHRNGGKGTQLIGILVLAGKMFP